LGATAGQTTLYFAEGNTYGNYDEFLCLYNPGTSSATVTVTYIFEGGTTQTNTYTVGANRRIMVDVAATVGGNKNVAIKISSTVAMVAERPMYFDYGWGTIGAHCVMGFKP